MIFVLQVPAKSILVLLLSFEELFIVEHIYFSQRNHLLQGALMKQSLVKKSSFRNFSFHMLIISLEWRLLSFLMSILFCKVDHCLSPWSSRQVLTSCALQTDVYLYMLLRIDLYFIIPREADAHLLHFEIWILIVATKWMHNPHSLDYVALLSFQRKWAHILLHTHLCSATWPSYDFLL